MIKICQSCKEKYNSRLIGDYGTYKCPSCENLYSDKVNPLLTISLILMVLSLAINTYLLLK